MSATSLGYCNKLITVTGVSTDSAYSHFAWATQPRKEGGLGPDLKLPLIADRNQKISRDYGVLIEEEGVALRGLFIIDPKGVLRQITINDLPVGRSVDETIRLIKAFQFVVSNLVSSYNASALIVFVGGARRGLPCKLAGGLQVLEGGPQGLEGVLLCG